MLRNVHIKNMALIDEIEANFEDGLNVLTGETGAGKSILLGAVTIGLGGRTGKELLREGAEYGLVELLFEIDHPETKDALQALDVSLSEENVLIISRKIYPNRVINKVNDELVTAGLLKDIAGVLIDIHSQHEHQSLLKKGNHIKILDRFGGTEIADLKKNVCDDYEAYMVVKRELDAAITDEDTRKRQMDYASFEVKEIKSANLTEGEEETLSYRYRQMTNSRQIMDFASGAYQITGYEQNDSAGTRLGHALSQMKRASDYDEKLLDLYEQIVTIDGLLNDFNRDLSEYMTEMTFDEQEFKEVEERLDLIHNLEAKYGKTIPDVLIYLEDKEKELKTYDDYETYLAKLSRNLSDTEHTYRMDAGALSQARKKLSAQLTDRIRDALRDMNFPDVRFEMEFEERKDPARDGLDDAYFMISTNIGEKMKPLWEVASGGELSRIMLAVKSCLAKEDAIDTLIFDEIDVGISGRTAQKVSEKLAALSQIHQVICISHLPQIAAMADAHYKIEKKVSGQKTITQMELLTEEDSITEIARILGGVEITDTVLKSAAEMKEMAKGTKKY